MPTQKVNFDPDCFGTIDVKKKKECGNCDYSGECESFKPKLKAYQSSAAEKGVEKYLAAAGEARKAGLGKLIGYAITIAILALVAMQVLQKF